MRAMIDGGLERPPEKELVKAAEAAIGVAADQIDIHGLEIGRRIDAPRDHALAQPVDVLGQNGFNAIGETLAHRIGPATVVRNRDLARGIALEHARRVRQLQPEDRLASRGTAWIESRRLAYADGRNRRQQTALAFVGGP